jgi:hypothetical protein
MQQYLRSHYKDLKLVEKEALVSQKTYAQGRTKD